MSLLLCGQIVTCLLERIMNLLGQHSIRTHHNRVTIPACEQLKCWGVGVELAIERVNKAVGLIPELGNTVPFCFVFLA